MISSQYRLRGLPVQAFDPVRRRLLGLMVASAGYAPGARGQPADSASVQMRVEQQALLRIPLRTRQSLSVQTDNSTDAQRLAEGAPPAHAVPVFFIVAGVLAAPIIYDAILEMVRETVYGGVIMDLRDKPPIITNSRAIPAGMVQVINPDGSTETHQSQSFVLETLKAWLSLGTKGSKGR
jgi:hypothetical protein